MKSLSFLALILIVGSCQSNPKPESEKLAKVKRNCKIILQRADMKERYPDEALEEWSKAAGNCNNLRSADSMFNFLLDRAVEAKLKLPPEDSGFDADDDPIIRQRVK